MTTVPGLEPDRCWAVGDSVGRGERTLRRKFSSWKLSSGVPDTEYPGDHVDALLRRIGPHAAAFAMPSPAWCRQVVWVRYPILCGGLELSTGTQGRFASPGLGIWFDICGQVDPHDETVALRAQLGVRHEGWFSQDPWP